LSSANTLCGAVAFESHFFGHDGESWRTVCSATSPAHGHRSQTHAQYRPMAADLHGGAAGGVLRGVRVGAGRAVVVAVRQREALAEACTRSTPFRLPSTWWLTDTGEIRCRRL
jgi:hypothetical protein